MNPVPGAPVGVFSADQLRAALWAGDGARVHAVLDGRNVPDLPARLAGADCMGWDCLQRGALTPLAALQAAYIVELAQASQFTDWLLHEASAAFEGWGVLWVSMQPLLALREHSRDLADVRMPDGRRRPWRWHDPELLECLLPGLSPPQQDQFFAADLQLVLIGPEQWVWWRRRDGVLSREARGLLAPAH